MIEVRPFETLGAANHGWLDARHHFSFAGYMDPLRMGWGSLRVWNDDRIEAGTGFPPHGHRDMEIITYVRKGAITHKDSLGNAGRTEAGDVQVMSAGTGIQHSEYNRETDATELFQIWIMPTKQGEAPSWGTRPFPRDVRDGKFALLASGIDGDNAKDENVLPIRTDSRVAAVTLRAGESADYALGSDRLAYLVAATGAIEVNGVAAQARDGIAINETETLHVTAREDAEIVLVDTI